MKLRSTLRALLVGSLLFTAASARAIEPIIFELDESYPIAQGGTLYLNSEDADVTITGSEREDARVVVHYEKSFRGFVSRHGGDDFQVVVQSTDGDLRIFEEGGDASYTFMFGSVTEDYSIAIELPPKVNLILRGDDDDYAVRNIHGSVELRFEDGDAEFHDMEAVNVDVDVEDGSVWLEGGSGDLRASAEDGRLGFPGGHYSSVAVNIEDGACDLETSLTDGGVYHFRSEDGAVELTLTGGGGEVVAEYDDGRVHARGDFEELEAAEGYMRWRYGVGDARVRLTTEDGRLQLKTR